ncbi:C-type lectin domain family 14 member A [Esox lucius]|uniref:C-type lectin domain family 14 member A n=1 Tax=Esox lucius TaxID=8010 RepID=UPI0014770CF2|nr:C-type lectin domain family 14 member A [Esox lucius]
MNTVSQCVSRAANRRVTTLRTTAVRSKVGVGRMEYHLICLWNLLLVVLCVPDDETYTVHLNSLSFDKALEVCQSNGFLTKIANLEEATKILKFISDTPATKDPFEFWVGLKKGKLDCVKLDEPLKGFKWTVDNSSDTKLGRWNQLPAQTCTGLLCVYLKLNETNKENWGLVSGSCKKERPFICKQAVTEECPTPHIPEAQSLRADPNDNRKLNLECRSGDVFTLTCSAKTLKWERSDGSALDGICASCQAGYRKDSSGNCVDINECLDKPCKFECVNTEGSHRCKCYDKDGNLYDDSVECNKTQETSATSEGRETHLDYSTTPQPTKNEWTFLSSPSDPTTSIISSNNVDLEEKRAVSIFIPGLIAVMVLVVVVVVMLAIVKICLRRRSQKLAMKKTEKVSMKRAEALKRDSLENSNEN